MKHEFKAWQPPLITATHALYFFRQTCMSDGQQVTVEFGCQTWEELRAVALSHNFPILPVGSYADEPDVPHEAKA